MKSLKQYSIPFTGLKIGQHHFSFEVGDQFFDEFEYSLVKRGDLKVALLLDKQETLMVLDFEIRGEVKLNCDRCLSDYSYPVDVKDRLLAKFSESEELEDSDEVMVLSKNDIEIDTSVFIYEMINLAVPYINVCDSPGNLASCDKEMLKKLSELSQKQESEQDNDPRWDALKNIEKN